MPQGYHRADGSIGLGDTSILFPVDGLAATVEFDEDAITRLRDADQILVVGPRSLASSYFLSNHRFTAIDIDSLPLGVRTELEQAKPDLDAYDAIRIGKESGSHTAGFGSAE